MTFEEMNKFIGGDYESPITMIVGETMTAMENDTMKVIQNYGIDVNKEELMKALTYDRNQYEKGYEDARKRFERPKGEWIRKDDVIQSIVNQYNEHNELVPSWLSTSDMRGDEA